MKPARRSIAATFWLLAGTVLAQETHLQQAKLVAGDAARGDVFGGAVAVAGDTAVVGAWFDDSGTGIGSGSVYVFRRSELDWTQQTKLVASDAGLLDEFGTAVAIAGDTIVVGAPRDDGSGSAYVFVDNAGVWSQQAKLIADDAAAGDHFGAAVAIAGETVVIGAPDAAGGGSAYVFVRSAGLWSQQAELTASDVASGAGFGKAVAIDSETAVVGAPGAAATGAAYVFVRAGATWDQEERLTASVAAAGDEFGHAVAVRDDTAVVGAWRADDGTTIDGGAVHVFVRVAAVWSEQARLLAADATRDARFGTSVALAADTVVAGARLADAGATDSGAAYVFERAGTVWTPVAQLLAGDAMSGDWSGDAVAVDGTTLLVGAPFADAGATINAGAAYVFMRCGLLAPYGAGLAGSGAIVPELSASGCALRRQRIPIQVSRGLGGAAGCLLFGESQVALPVFGGTVLVEPLVCLAHSLEGAGEGAGTRTFPLVIPNLLAYVGHDFFFQALYVDPGAPQGVSFTNGLHLRSN